MWLGSLAKKKLYLIFQVGILLAEYFICPETRNWALPKSFVLKPNCRNQLIAEKTWVSFCPTSWNFIPVRRGMKKKVVLKTILKTNNNLIGWFLIEFLLLHWSDANEHEDASGLETLSASKQCFATSVAIFVTSKYLCNLGPDQAWETTYYTGNIAPVRVKKIWDEVKIKGYRISWFWSSDNAVTRLQATEFSYFFSFCDNR